MTVDGMNWLDKLCIDRRVIQVYRWGCKLGNLGKRSLARFLLLRTLTTWKLVQIHNTRYRLRFSLPCLDGSFLDHWRCGASLSPLVMVFSLFSLIVVIPAMRKIKLKIKNKKKKKKEKREKGVRKMEWTILTSTSGFLVTKILSSKYWAKSPRS